MERKLNILLVEDDIDACNRFESLADGCSDLDIIGVTNSARKALETVRESLPDVIILDLELHLGSGNGLSVLKELREMNPVVMPYILVTTNNSSGVTYETARALGADFIMSKHQEDYSEEAALEFIRMISDSVRSRRKAAAEGALHEPPAQHSKRLTRRIMTELDRVGISPKAVGYKYLSDAILIVSEKPTQNLCSIIGRRYGKTDSSVERAMQNAIDKAWRTTDIDTLLRVYTAPISSAKGVPTITEFIYYYAGRIKNDF